MIVLLYHITRLFVLPTNSTIFQISILSNKSITTIKATCIKAKELEDDVVRDNDIIMQTLDVILLPENDNNGENKSALLIAELIQKIFKFVVNKEILFLVKTTILNEPLIIRSAT
ncbi:hypothetical protein CEXT_769921 [Caerostris extrusa]|uniref:Uncharacterized protein n=1 Tax=Caerostris extrusa TaxID=172846 RepID=A0AAV4RRT5_CAEEX|nr:hypothetical protein CEXT_769921 [Caerostris extrusa]